MASALLLDPLPVDCEDGAEVHGVHVLGVAVHELADDDAAGALRGVERVPERAHVGRCRAQPDAVVIYLDHEPGILLDKIPK
jgi:hypothetical protein